MALAVVLALVNALFHVLVRRLSEDSPRRAIETNLWLQIVADLLLVTAVVHLVGSTCTLIAFVYLLHVATAGVFFPRRDSLLVVLLAVCLYLACLSFEILGLLPMTSVLATARCTCQSDPVLRLIFAGSAVLIWVVIWALISTLSEAIRRRDERLSVANERIVMADREQTGRSCTQPTISKRPSRESRAAFRC